MICTAAVIFNKQLISKEIIFVLIVAKFDKIMFLTLLQILAFQFTLSLYTYQPWELRRLEFQ